jgi:hypothetical protein
MTILIKTLLFVFGIVGVAVLAEFIITWVLSLGLFIYEIYDGEEII